MTREGCEDFAARWADAWNRRDIEAVLEHFTDDVVFTSPTALTITSKPTIRGKAGLRAYWAAALARISSLRFTVDRVLWDPVSRELAILYTSDINGTVKKVSENLAFNDEGLVASAEVLHGVGGK
ncbi:MAG: nuclear transport factor 2 family protein [Gammaproteobacteria bacterium PRO9]|nr:nuclear transport factor 2 family protein [Gammaproteobacteria bacterium PRO9]